MLQLLHLFRRRRAKRFSTSLVAVTMGLTLLVACAEEEPEPKFEAEPAVEASTPATATSSEKETVKEFLVRWAEAERDMQNTGKTEEYAALSAGCEPCDALVKRVEAIYENGGFIRTEGRSIKRVGERAENFYLINVHAAPTEYQSEAGAAVENLEGGKSHYRVRLAEDQGEWVLAQLVEEGQ